MTKRTQPVRVAFLQAWLPFGGAERLVQSLVMRMDPARIDARLVNLYAPGAVGEELIAAGHRSIDRLASSKLDLRIGGRLREALERERVEVVYVYDSALPMFWAGLQRRRRSVPKLVLGFHSTGKLGDPVQHFLANRATLPVADRFVALAGSHLEYLASHLHLDRSRFDTIVSGVDLERFRPVQDRVALRRELGLPETAPLAAIVAALRPEKNHALFVQAASRVHRELPEARFLVIGDGPERAKIEAEIAAHGLGGIVLMLGARRDIPQLWPAMDVAVLSSHPVVETLPVTLLEAHACGVPGVSTDVGSVRDVIAQGETGFLVPIGDVDALARRLTQLLRDEPERRRMGEAARIRAVREFDLANMVKAYEDLFVRMAEGEGR